MISLKTQLFDLEIAQSKTNIKTQHNDKMCLANHLFFKYFALAKASKQSHKSNAF